MTLMQTRKSRMNFLIVKMSGVTKVKSQTDRVVSESLSWKETTANLRVINGSRKPALAYVRFELGTL